MNKRAAGATLGGVTTPFGPPPDQGQPGYPPPMYPSLPMAPVAAQNELAHPRAVRLAFWLTLGGAVLFVALVAIALSVSAEDIRDLGRGTTSDGGAPVDEHTVRTNAAGTQFVLAFAALLATAPFITFGALLGGGRNWARVLLTVLVSVGGVLVLILMLPSYASYGLLIRLMAVALIGLSIAIVSLLFSRASNAFFTGPR